MCPEAKGGRFLRNIHLNLTNYRCDVPEDCNLDAHYHENGKSYSVIMFTGNPKPNIFWKKDGDNMAVHRNQWSLKLENLSVHDIGKYTCFVCSSIACINFVFEVDVIGMFLCV
jgi:hypothetical protein